MLSVRLVCVGKLKEKYYMEAMEEYSTRLSPFCRFEVTELSEVRLPSDPSQADIDLALKKEAAAIEAAIPKGAGVIAMCIEGKGISSEGLAKKLNDLTVSGVSKLCFVIGGSFGLSSELKAKADLRMSMSAMTFPHHLARVMLTEQIYRAFMINTGTKYHK